MCFIDGDHSYSGVKGDYAQLAPHCRIAMFHDIQDSSTMLDSGSTYAGGVPMFWAHARSHVRSARVVELTRQGAPFWPVFGIGLLLTGPAGTAEPDDGMAVAQWPPWQGQGAAALRRALCGGNHAAEPQPGQERLRPWRLPERLPARYVAHEIMCPIATEENLKSILEATKRTVPKSLLTFAMGLRWNETRVAAATARLL